MAQYKSNFLSHKSQSVSENITASLSESITQGGHQLVVSILEDVVHIQVGRRLCFWLECAELCVKALYGFSDADAAAAGGVDVYDRLAGGGKS